jgi:hypothetical protein
MRVSVVGAVIVAGLFGIMMLCMGLKCEIQDPEREDEKGDFGCVGVESSQFVMCMRRLIWWLFVFELLFKAQIVKMRHNGK